MRSSIPRVRSVRYKDGRAPVIGVIRAPDPAIGLARARDFFEQTLEAHGDCRIGAMALVIWDHQFNATTFLGSASHFPAAPAMLPDMAKAALQTHRIRSLARDVFND
jgi:hypothetical protein